MQNSKKEDSEAPDPESVKKDSGPLRGLAVLSAVFLGWLILFIFSHQPSEAPSTPIARPTAPNPNTVDPLIMNKVASDGISGDGPSSSVSGTGFRPIWEPQGYSSAASPVSLGWENSNRLGFFTDDGFFGLMSSGSISDGGGDTSGPSLGTAVSGGVGSGGGGSGKTTSVRTPNVPDDTITGTGWKGTNGAGGIGQWSTTANWDATPPNTTGTGDRNLFFGQGYKAAGGTNATANNDLTNWHGYRMTFQDSNAAGNGTDGTSANDTAFTITGNAFGLFDFSGNQPRIENDSFLTQTFSLSGTLTLDGTNGGQNAEINPVNANLVFNNAIDLSGTTQLRIFGNNGKTVTFNNPISSSGNSGNNTFVIQQNSTAIFAAANTYLGDTFINAGKLQFNSGGSVSSDFIRVGDTAGTNAAELDLNGASLSTKINVRSGSSGTKTIAEINAGANTLSGNIFLDNDVTMSSVASGSLTLSGGTLDLKNQTMNFTGAGNYNVSGVLQQSTGTGKVTMSSSGTLTYTNAMTYSGDTTVTNGTLAFGSGGSANSSTLRLGSTSGANNVVLNLTVAAGGQSISDTINPVTTSGTGTVTMNSQNTSNTNTYSGHIGLDRAFTITQSGGGTLAITQARSGVSTTTGADIKGFTLTLSPSSTGTINFSGDIYNSTGSGSLTINSTGTVTLSGNNTFTGGVTLNTGGTTLNINSATALGTGTFTIGNSNVVFDNTSIGGAITETNNNAITFNGSPTFTGTNDLNMGTGAVNLNLASGTRTLTVNGSILTLGGVISSTGGGLQKSGAGTLVLSNTASTYAGTTAINAGVLSITAIKNLSTNSSIGAPTTTANGTINIGNTSTSATLKYTGSGDTTNRVINLAGSSGGATLDQSGTGNLLFTSSLTATGGGSKNLTLQGSTAGTGEISGSIVDNTGANKTSLVKAGTGTWTLSGNNTFTGTTTINSNGGKLIAGAAGALGTTSSITVNNGGTLAISGSGTLNRINNSAGISLGGGTFQRIGNTTGANAVSEGTGASTTNGGVSSTGTNAVGLGALTLTANSTLDFNSSGGGVGTLVFSSFVPNGNTLNILNYSSSANALNPLVSGTDGVDDRLIFNQDQATNLTNFSFGGISAIEIALGGGFFEIVPIPETSTWVGGALSLVGLILLSRRRLIATRTVENQERV